MPALLVILASILAVWFMVRADEDYQTQIDRTADHLIDGPDRW